MLKVLNRTTGLLFALALICGFFAYDMFCDGIFYGAVSRNLLLGIGSFWRLYYTKEIYPVFYEHPPLHFLLQAKFFGFLHKVFGLPLFGIESIFMEKIYGVLSFCLTFYLVRRVWRLIYAEHPDPNIQEYYFWPSFLWFTCPLTFWLYTNNVLEVTLTFFSLLAVYLFMLSIDKTSSRLRLSLAFLAGLSVFAAFLVKGPTGLYPLVLPLVLYLIFPAKRAQLVSATLGLFSAVAVGAVWLLVDTEARFCFANYFRQQLYAGVLGQREHTSTRFYILFKLLEECGWPSLVVLLLAAFMKLKRLNFKPLFKFTKEGQFFLALAISSSLPVMLSLKQSTRYITQSLMFYGMFFASLQVENFTALASWFKQETRRLYFAKLAFAGFTLVSLSLIAFFCFKYPYYLIREKELYEEILKDPQHLEQLYFQDIAGCHMDKVYMLYGPIANLARVYNASLVAPKADSTWFLLDKHLGPDCPPLRSKSCTVVNPEAKRFYLYHCPLTP